MCCYNAERLSADNGSRVTLVSSRAHATFHDVQDSAGIAWKPFRPLQKELKQLILRIHRIPFVLHERFAQTEQ
ncbi:hypothetical protein GN244_ATG06223 [Phytophthora infestans]|uniref:Uncharacterized protein n=1 Tax=Phytophthora infestans TaxID=4787 RepID=A0A833T861_PHYIN|nr:hypothetical protein GN244_ATG06223 [Phytophthora infestans]